MPQYSSPPAPMTVSRTRTLLSISISLQRLREVAGTPPILKPVSVLICSADANFNFGTANSEHALLMFKRETPDMTTPKYSPVFGEIRIKLFTIHSAATPSAFAASWPPTNSRQAPASEYPGQSLTAGLFPTTNTNSTRRANTTTCPFSSATTPTKA